MQVYDFRKLSRARQLFTVAFFVGLAILLGFFLDPETGWQNYARTIGIGAIGVVVTSMAGGYQSYPETVDEARRYRPVEALIIAVVVGLVAGFTVYLRHHTPGFAVASTLTLTVWLFAVTMAGTWILRRVTRGRDSDQTNDPGSGSSQSGTYENRIRTVRREARPRSER